MGVQRGDETSCNGRQTLLNLIADTDTRRSTCKACCSSHWVLQPVKKSLSANTFFTFCGGTPRRSSLRHCATSRKAAGSIPDGVTGIFQWHNPSGCAMALGSIQTLKEMSTRNISWGGKGGWCVALTTLPLSSADCLEIWEPQPPGTLWACPGL